MWDLPGSGIEPASPALVGGFLLNVPPGKSQTQDLESAEFLPRVLKYHGLGHMWCVSLTREQAGLRLLMGAAHPLVVWRLSPDPRSMLLTPPTRRCTAGHGWGSEVGVCVPFPRNRGSLWNHRYESRHLCGPTNSMPPPVLDPCYFPHP